MRVKQPKDQTKSGRTGGRIKEGSEISVDMLSALLLETHSSNAAGIAGRHT